MIGVGKYTGLLGTYEYFKIVEKVDDHPQVGTQINSAHLGR